MSAYPHFLHVYQKPALGTKFIRRYAVANYRHKISAVGGCDTASCDIGMSFGNAERFLEQMLGNRIAVYVDNPAAPIWEGLIGRITFEYGPIVYTASIDEMGNRIRVTYNDPDAATPQTQVAATDNAASQAIYGIKEFSIDLGVNYTSSANLPTRVRDLQIASRAWPQTSAAAQGSAGQALVRLEMQGVYNTVNWSIYRQTATAGVNASVLLTTVVTGDDNGTTFYDNADTNLISSNIGFTVQQKQLSGISRWQFIQQIVEAGDGTNRWIMGVTPTDFNRGTRIFYYQQAAPTVKYIALLRKGAGRIRNLYGKPVDAWDVRPDAGIRVNDALTGWALQGDDPRQVYIEAVDYDAERGQVSYQSADDVTIEGVFRIKKQFRPTNARFGAAIRGSY